MGLIEFLGCNKTCGECFFNAVVLGKMNPTDELCLMFQNTDLILSI